MRTFLVPVVFLSAFALAVPLLVSVHTFFAEIPFDAVLTEGAVTLLLYFDFGLAALGGAFSLSLTGMPSTSRFGLAAVHISVLIVTIELFIISFDALDRIGAAAPMLVVFVLNPVLVMFFFRLAVKVSNQKGLWRPAPRPPNSR